MRRSASCRAGMSGLRYGCKILNVGFQPRYLLRHYFLLEVCSSCKTSHTRRLPGHCTSRAFCDLLDRHQTTPLGGLLWHFFPRARLLRCQSPIEVESWAGRYLSAQLPRRLLASAAPMRQVFRRGARLSFSGSGKCAPERRLSLRSGHHRRTRRCQVPRSGRKHS